MNVQVERVPCKGCILVVEDDPSIREALTSCFEDLGCTAVGAADGLEALDCLKRTPRPCFILLDLNMPRLDGHGFARLLCQDARHSPIISMTAGRDRLRPSMVHSHVEKPFAFEVLAPSIERLCQDPDWLHGAR